MGGSLKNIARGLLIASLIFALSYPLIWDLGWPELATTAWKGAGVGLLALLAAREARSLDGWLLTAVLAFGAFGDVLLVGSMTTGALAFAVGHVLAIWLYLRNRRQHLAPGQKALALLVIPASVLIAWLLPADRGQAPGVAVYALFVAAMAASAWTSRFPRYRTGIGAMMFLASDLLIFARMGPLAGAVWVGLAIWLLYYVGQLLIWRGVRSTIG